MKKLIRVASFITSKYYKNYSEPSISFIYDERYKVYYILKGNLSELWNIILSKENYDDVFSYAYENNISDLLIELLVELKQKEFIYIDKNFNFTGYKHLTAIVNESDTDSFNALYTGIAKIVNKYNLLNSVTLQLSYKCNLFCKHCFNPKNIDNYELSFEIAKKFIDEAYELGMINLSFTGGECTCSKDFLKIAKYVREKHIFLTFLTNAQLMFNDDYFDEIIRIYPYEIRTSIYSMNPDIHDYITGVKGSHAKTLHVMKKIREKNIKIVINCPNLKPNKNHYIDVKKFADSIGANMVYSSRFINNINNNNDFIKLSEDEVSEFYFNELKNGKPFRKEFKKCDRCLCSSTRLTHLCLTPNANVTLCNDFDYSLGNYNSVSLKEIWETSMANAVSTVTSNNLHDCFNYDYCRYCTYCPKLPMYDSEFMKKSETICSDARAYYNALKKFESLNLIEYK